MNLFKARTADELESRLWKMADKYSENLNLREKVSKNVEQSISRGNKALFTGLFTGMAGIVGGIGIIIAAPAIATTAVVGGFTIAGVTMLGGGAGMSLGLAYKGFQKLVEKFENGKLGSSYEQASEEGRLNRLPYKMERQFNSVLRKQNSNIEGSEMYHLQSALQNGNNVEVTRIIKELTNQAMGEQGSVEVKGKLFNKPVAANLESKLNSFYEKYQNIATKEGLQNDKSKVKTKMQLTSLVGATGMFTAMMGATIGVTTPIILGGVVVGAASFGAVALMNIARKKLDNIVSQDLTNNGNNLIKKYSKDLNISESELRSIRNYKEDTLKGKETKEDFVNKIKDKVKV
jgi:hypothetical protein